MPRALAALAEGAWHSAVDLVDEAAAARDDPGDGVSRPWDSGTSAAAAAPAE